MKIALIRPEVTEITVTLSVEEARKLKDYLGCTSIRNVKRLMQEESIAVVTDAIVNEVDLVLSELYDGVLDKLYELRDIEDGNQVKT